MKTKHAQVRKAVSIPEAARLLEVHQNTIRRWIAQGELPAHRLGRTGRHLRIYEDDLAELADTGPVTLTRF